jgi:hypothetical protein
VGDPAYDTYTLDLKSGRAQMQITLRADSSFLTRHGDDGGWSASSTAEISLAQAILSSAAEVERRTSPDLVRRACDNVIELKPRAEHRAAKMAARWLRATATRAVLAAAFTFVLLALL